MGREPADLVLAGGSVVNVFSGEVLAADVAIVDGVIAAVAPNLDGNQRIEVSGRIVAPSFIDAHIHIESTLLWVTEFAKTVVPHGTGLVVTDPHEIANVAGLPGVDAFRRDARGLPLHVRFTAPSCVPASPHESPGAMFETAEIAQMLSWPETVGLGELMNFPGVLAADHGIGLKLVASSGRRRDGHAPGVTGKALQAYAGSGPASDHESTSYDEALEKIRAGLMLMIREGSSEHNLHELLPLVTDQTYPRCCFASDDRDCHALQRDGHVDEILRRAVAGGLDPIRAIRMATWNAADYWRLDGVGAIAPGYEANLVVLGDLANFNVESTYFQGKLVAQHGEYVGPEVRANIPVDLRESMNLAPVSLRDLRLDPDAARVAVGVIPGQIVTKRLDIEPRLDGNEAVVDLERDLLKLVCVERHQATGRVGVGYVTGFGLKRGALASSIAHDAHNIVAVGADDVDILAAIATVASSQGGLAVVAGGEVLAHLPLPILGLLSDRTLEEVAGDYGDLEAAAHALGSQLPSPFGLLAFMSLSVIPEARVTDRGFLVV